MGNVRQQVFLLASARKVVRLDPVSTTEWTPSENIAELPVKKAATNFIIAINALPTRAA